MGGSFEFLTWNISVNPLNLGLGWVRLGFFPSGRVGSCRGNKKFWALSSQNFWASGQNWVKIWGSKNAIFKEKSEKNFSLPPDYKKNCPFSCFIKRFGKISSSSGLDFFSGQPRLNILVFEDFLGRYLISVHIREVWQCLGKSKSQRVMLSFRK